MIVVAIIALISAIAIPNLLRARISANEAAAQATLKSVSSALETYAIANGQYPGTTTALLGQSPPYLNKDYFVGIQQGYVYAATLASYSYTVTAAPNTSSSGKKTFTAVTGAVLSSSP